MNKTLLPPNESELLKAKELALRSVFFSHSNALTLDPLTCDKKLLSHLAQVVQVLFWSDSLTTKEKRKLISETIEIHRYLGTPYAIKKVFELLELNVKIVEWFHEDLEPYHFYIEATLGKKEISKELLEQIHKYIEVHKNVRSELDYISIFSDAKSGKITYGGVVAETHSNSHMVQLYSMGATREAQIQSGIVAEIHVSISNTGGEE
jgi:phage tail P2-like protein